MHSIKKIFFAFLFFSALLLSGQKQAEAQALSQLEISEGDIVLQNIFPNSEDIRINIKKASLEGLDGDVFIGKNPDKVAEIDITLTPKADGTQQIEAVLDDIRRKGLEDLLPFLPPLLPKDEDYTLSLEFSIGTEFSLSPMIFTLESDSLNMAGEMVLDEFKLASLEIKIKSLQASLLEALPKAFLDSDDLEIEGEFTGDIIWRGSNSNIIDLNLQATNIKAESETLFPKLQLIKAPRIQASYDYGKGVFRFDSVSMGLRNTRFNAVAEIIFENTDIIFNTDLQMIDGSYDVNDLHDDWPLTVAPIPRRWVLANIHQGKAVGLDLSLQGRSENGEMNITHFFSEIKTQGGKFTYWDAMPDVILPEAIVRFKDGGLSITSDNAETADMQNIPASIFITLPTDGSDNMAVAEIGILQNYDSLSRLLDRDGVELLSKIGVPDDASGDRFIGKTNLRFPLVRTLSVADIEFEFAGSISNFYSPNAPFGANIEIEAEEVRVQGDNKNIAIISDEIIMDSIITSLDWQIPLQGGKGSVYAMELVTDKNFQNAPLFQQAQEALGADSFDKYVNGIIKTEFSFEKTSDGDSATLIIDLTDADLTIEALGITKPKGLRGIATIEAITEQDIISRISNFTYQDNNNFLHMQVEFDFTQPYIVQLLNLSRLRTPRFDLSAEVRQLNANINSGKNIPTFHANVDAKRIDLAHMFGYVFGIDDDDEAADDSVNDEDEASPDFTIALVASNLYNIDELSGIENLDFNASYENNRLRTVYATMNIDDQAGYIDYDNQSHLKARIPDLGKLLFSTGLSDSLSGGDTEVQIIALDENSPIAGDFRIQDFRIKEIPVMARLLQLASAADAYGAINGDGLHFDRWEGRLSYQDGYLSLANSQMQGNTISLTMRGNIEADSGDIALRGSLVPFSWLIPRVSSVPALKSIFTDEHGNSLFAFVYGIDGNFNKPSIWMNPLSLLTPGSLKNIFDNEPKPIPNKDDE